MNNFTLLKCIGEIDDRYILSAQRALRLIPTSQSKKQSGYIPFKRYLILAAVIALTLALVGCAVYFGLRHLKVGEYTNTMFIEPPVVTQDTESGQMVTVQPEPTTKDLISLQGFVDSVPYKASREWQRFLQSYDEDGSLLAQSDFDDYQEPMEYMAYMCYTQEMQDKIDEICEKYELELLGPTNLADYAWQVFDAVGIRGITYDNGAAIANFDSGYFYKDGSFNLGGTIELLDDDAPWAEPVRFQYRCVQNSSFDGVSLAVGDIDSYTEWHYTLKDGTTVLLALSEEQALIIADMESFFGIVNIIRPYVDDGSGEIQYMSPAALEAVADTFTFAYKPSAPSADDFIQPEWFFDTTE